MSESCMQVPFVKMHGAGNDYIYINALSEIPCDLPMLSRQISDRHFGIGSDGLVAIMPSDCADFRMRMFNADGSEAEMCGNASRCIGKYVYEKGLTDKTEIQLETLSGIKILRLNVKEGKVDSVTVDMGVPEFRPDRVPAVSAHKDKKVSEKEIIAGKEYEITAVSMGNPHAVIFTSDLSDEMVLGAGPQIETAEIFPRKTNVEFVNVKNRDEVDMRVWERGSGETMACGTGACAVAVAGVLNNLTNRDVILNVRGGRLEVKWDKDTDHVFLTGGAEFIAEGTFFFRPDGQG